MAALALSRYEVVSLFVVAGVTLMLLFIGIRNAWDTVECVTLQRWTRPPRGNVDQAVLQLAKNRRFID